MKTWLVKAKTYGLALASSVMLVAGAVALVSCAGSGGPIGVATGGNGGGGVSAAFVALEPAGQKGATYIGPNVCKTCHNGEGGYEAIYAEWTNTVHYTKGVTCENCHGPGSKHAAGPAATNIIGFPTNNSYVVCAQCHGQIATDWSNSPHAQLAGGGFPVQDAASNPEGAGKGERCLSCHSGLLRAEYTERGKDPSTMTDAQIVGVANDTLKTVPYTASCATCHNPHKKTGNIDVDGDDVQLYHAVAQTNIAPVAIGKSAASFTTMNQVCAECHNGWGSDPSDAALNNQAKNSRPSFHEGPQYNMLMGFSGVDGGGYTVGSATHATMAGQCAKCHMPPAGALGEDRHTFTVSYDVSCTPCHTPADAANRAATIQAQTEAGELQLLQRLQSWSAANYKGSTVQWDYPGQGSSANQSNVPIQIKRARHNYYFVLNDRSYGPHNAAYTNLLLQVANQNLDAINVAPSSKVDMSPAQMKSTLDAQFKQESAEDRSVGP